MDIIKKIVYIIESPSGEDVLVERNEGKILKAILDLSEIPSDYYPVVNKKILNQVLDRIAMDLKKKEEKDKELKIIHMPYLHFSFHSNDNGFQFASTETVSWKEFIKMLSLMNDIYGWNEDGKSRLSLCLSTCYGLSITNHITDYNKIPFTGIVACKKAIEWSDALIAFITLYHQVIKKNNLVRPSTISANSAAGLMGNELQAIFSENIRDLRGK